MPIYAFIYSCLPHYIRLPRAYPLIRYLISKFNDITRNKSSAIKQNKIMEKEIFNFRCSI